MLDIFFLLFLLFIIIITTFIAIFVFWLFLIVIQFVKYKITKKPLKGNYTIGIRNILLIFTFFFISISFVYIKMRYDKARICIILPNGYTVGKKSVFDFYTNFRVHIFVIRDSNGKVLPVDDVDWTSYRIKLNTLNKEHRSYHDPNLTNPLLYESSYKGGSVFYIKAKKFTDWREIYGDDFIENTPQPHEYYIGDGLYGIFSFYNELKNNPLYPKKNCSIDIFKFTKGY